MVQPQDQKQQTLKGLRSWVGTHSVPRMTDRLIDTIAELPQTYGLSYPAVNGETVTEGHVKYCTANGHATHTINGIPSAYCPRCGTPIFEPRRSFYADQPQNTTAVYVNGFPRELVADNEYVAERDMITRYRAENRYIERVVFGHGRVALIFETR